MEKPPKNTAEPEPRTLGERIEDFFDKTEIAPSGRLLAERAAFGESGEKHIGPALYPFKDRLASYVQICAMRDYLNDLLISDPNSKVLAKFTAASPMFFFGKPALSGVVPFLACYNGRFDAVEVWVHLRGGWRPGGDRALLV